MNTHRSETYLKTIVNDSYAAETIAAVRAGARAYNRAEKAIASVSTNPHHTRLTKKVDVFGRLGKNNAAAASYRERAEKNRRNYSCRNPYQRIAIADAATIDIYVSTKIVKG